MPQSIVYKLQGIFMLGFRYSFTMFFCFFVVGLLSSTSAVASPQMELDWKIFQTEHFRIHYTKEYEPWTIAAAHEMEASRATLLKQQKRTLPEVVDVIVFDPLNDSNGYAIPFSNKPFMALYTTPPQSDSNISNSTSWPQLLALHEYTHLLHLSQPSRNQWRKFVASIYDVYDVVNGMTERWVAEGYATLLESKLTGRGRLYDVQVEMMLQQFAREGGWPTFNELSNVEGRYRLGAMAYLIGGRYFAWLEENYSEQKLDAVWTRMKGVKNRTFEQAFQGVFNQPAKLLYRRYVAEYTQKVMNSENKAALNDYKLWFDGEYEITEPAISPNQELIAIVEKSPRNKGLVNLTVYETQDNQKAKDKFEKAQKELLEADPVDIADVQPEVFKRVKKYSLAQQNFNGIRHPRWSGNRALLFIANTTDKKGELHKDLFRWTFSTNRVKKLTSGLNIRRFDHDPETGMVYAELNKFGFSSLVQFDIANITRTMKTEELAVSSLSSSYDFPRLNPKNNNQLAYLERSSNQPWQIKIRDLNTQHISLAQLPDKYQFLSYLNWSNDGKSLYFVAGQDEALKLYRYVLAEEKLFTLTEGHMPVAWPMELQGDQSTRILLSSYRATGPNLYELKTDKSEWSLVTQLSDQADWSYLDAVSPYPIKMPAAKMSQDTSIGEIKDYVSSEGLWRQQKTITLGGHFSSASTNLMEIGIKGGDLLQMLNWQINSSFDLLDDSASGISGYVNWQQLPVKLSGDFHYFDLNYQQQSTAVGKDSSTFAGFGLTADYPYRLAETYRGKFFVAFDHNEAEPNGYAVVSNQTLSYGHEQSFWFDRQTWGIEQSSRFTWLSGEAENDLSKVKNTFDGLDMQISLGAHYHGIKFQADYIGAERTGSNNDVLSIGGMPSTLIAQNMFSHWLLVPELPYGFDSGNEFDRITLSLSQRAGGGQLYFSELYVDSLHILDIYGIRGSQKIDVQGPGLTNLAIDFGFASIVDRNDNYELQAWFGLRYQY